MPASNTNEAMVYALVRALDQMRRQNQDLHNRLMAKETPERVAVLAAASQATARGEQATWKPPEDVPLEIVPPAHGSVDMDA